VVLVAEVVRLLNSIAITFLQLRSPIKQMSCVGAFAMLPVTKILFMMTIRTMMTCSSVNWFRRLAGTS
jgi:hypothetical protein